MANAIRTVTKEVSMLLCTRHKYPNILKRTSKKTAEVYKEAVNAVTPGQLATELSAVADMSPEHREVMNEFDDEQLYPVAAVAIGLTTYGRTVSQLVEILNNSTMLARNLDPFSALVWFVEKEMKRFYEGVKIAHSGNPADLLDHVKEAFKKLAGKQTGMRVTRTCRGKYQVRSETGNPYAVDLPRLRLQDDSAAFGSCEFGQPLVNHMPCKHMFAASIHAGVSTGALVPHSFSRALMRLVFPNDSVYPTVAVENVRAEINRDANKRQPVVGAAKQGRPSVTRICGFLEYAALHAKS
jgi:hypothetical protein